MIYCEEDVERARGNGGVREGLSFELFTLNCCRYEKASRLLLLSTSQLSSLLIKLSELHKRGKITEHSRSILAIIPVCFPEFHNRPDAVTDELISKTCLELIAESIL